MRTGLIIILCICFQAVQAESWNQQVKFDELLTQVEVNYQQGDQELQKTNLDSALQKYVQARRLINELFFLLLDAQKSGQISKNFTAQKWDLISAKMQIKLPYVTDCSFECCYIYHEEKAANWCIAQIKTGSDSTVEKLLLSLTDLLEQNANAQLKHFFAKIFLFLQWQIGWQNYQQLIAAPVSISSPLLSARNAFFKAFENYQAKQGR